MKDGHLGGSDIESFEDFYSSEHQRVFRSVYAFCGNRQLSEDSTHEAFSRALARWRKLQRQQWAGAWVTTVAINECKKILKKRGRESSVESLQFERNVEDDRPDIVDALRRLPPRQREAVVLHYLADYPIAVVAQTMDLSEGAVKTHLSRARSSLRAMLEEVDV